jgi:hypothetical protein
MYLELQLFIQMLAVIERKEKTQAQYSRAPTEGEVEG